MLIRARVHPFPSRTRKLSSLLLTILGWRRPGKIGSANTKPTTFVVGFAFCFQSLSRVVRDIRFSTSCGTRQARWSLCANGDVRGNVKMGRGCLSGRCAGVIHSAAARQHCTRSRCVMPRTGRRSGVIYSTAAFLYASYGGSGDWRSCQFPAHFDAHLVLLGVGIGVGIQVEAHDVEAVPPVEGLSLIHI